ncbi:hypothetical protein TNCT_326281 [Trichonephila clavata]|uniref:Uncharacterized protein n=1 Tax=Trichonephila clavata TaxID=2740835 RepID=A0A8X6HV59_TRICU|nr:hypothetical protein TNCT_326281 [Trichonephila clavata]
MERVNLKFNFSKMYYLQVQTYEGKELEGFMRCVNLSTHDMYLEDVDRKGRKELIHVPFSSLMSLKMKIDGETEYRLYLTPETDSDAELRRRYFDHCYSEAYGMEVHSNLPIHINDSFLLRSPLTYDGKLEELFTPNQATQYITLNRFQWSDFLHLVEKNGP